MDIDNLKDQWIATLPNGVDRVISGLVRELTMRNNRNPPEVKLSKKEGQQLIQDYKNAEQGRSTAGQFMVGLAEVMDIDQNRNPVFVAPMKDWERAKEKYNIPNRDTNDIGRGSIYFTEPKHIENFYQALKSINDNGCIEDVGCEKASVQNRKVDDSLKKPKKSGYAGSINIDINVKITNDKTAKFEVQIRPEQYKETDEQSHMLYDMIRILEETPEPLQPREHLKVKVALIRANRALFDEEAYKSGLMELRNKPNNVPSDIVMANTTNIINSISDKIDKVGGTRQAWQDDTMEAILFAKTSILNIYSKNKMKSLRPSALEL